MPKLPKLPKPPAGDGVTIRPATKEDVEHILALNPDMLTANPPFDARVDAWEAEEATRELLQGKPERMVRRLAAGAELRPEERAALVRWLRGEIRKPKHRPKDRKLPDKKLDATFMFRELRASGWKEDPATLEVAKRFRVSQNTIRGWVKDCEGVIILNKCQS